MPNTNMATFGTRLWSTFRNGIYVKPNVHKTETGAPSANNNQGARDMVRAIIQRSPNQTSDMVDIIDENGNILFSVDNSGNEIQSGVTNSKQCVAQVTLTAAQVLGMFAAPVTLVAAPGAGVVIQVDQVMVQVKPGGTQFASGGVVTVQYTGGSAVHSSSIPAATVNSASGSMNFLPPVAAVLQAPANTGLTITNATGAFTTGTGSLIVTVYYSLITQS